MHDIWFKQLVDDTDPHTPLFWETMRFASRQGWDLMAPVVELGPPTLGVLKLELQRKVALNTPTMALEIIE